MLFEARRGRLSRRSWPMRGRQAIGSDAAALAEQPPEHESEPRTEPEGAEQPTKTPALC